MFLDEVVVLDNIFDEMNNLSWMARKVRRDMLERNVISSIRKYLPHVEQYTSLYRSPILPKIVAYSASANSMPFLKR